MEDLIELRDGWWWPKYDKKCYPYLLKEQYVPKTVSDFCNKKQVIIQAGGNAGMYVRMYGEIFETVYTFEPDPLNFYCLVKNTASNVVKFQSCVGNKRELVTLSYERHRDDIKRSNSGGFWVVPNGNIPVIKIDDLNLQTCDLIHLDIEGFEGEAILGAQETIKRTKPIIALELRGHGEQYGWSDQRIKDLVISMGYEIASSISHDTIFKPIK